MKPWQRSGITAHGSRLPVDRSSAIVDNTLDRQFDVEAPDKALITDVVLQALLMAVWRCSRRSRDRRSQSAAMSDVCALLNCQWDGRYVPECKTEMGPLVDWQLSALRVVILAIQRHRTDFPSGLCLGVRSGFWNRYIRPKSDLNRSLIDEHELRQSTH